MSNDAPSFAASNSTAQQKVLTLADIDRMAQMLRNIPPEPLGEWMRQQGMPPEDWHLVLPEKVRAEVEGPMFWPSYVAFSPVLDEPVFLARRMLEIGA